MSTDPGRTSRQHAIAWLAHPATVAAVIVMAVNDHLLKSTYGTWWTGKLSDVAGLVFAPALLAVAVSLCAPRVRPRSLPACSVVAVGIGFAVVKTTAQGAAAASAAWTALAGPSVVLRDPTDLLAIPALAVAWAVGRHAVERQSAVPAPAAANAVLRRRTSAVLRWGVVLPLVLIVTTATSMADDDQEASEIAKVNDVLYAGRSEYPGAVTWSTSVDGVTWTEVPADQAAWQTELVDSAGGTATRTCVPTRLDTCFRAAPGRLAVEMSVDGGKTWTIDWEVPEETRAALAHQYIGGSLETLRTDGVAIFETRDGYRVYAANRMDGFAVRDEGGTWQRVGFTFFSTAAEPARSLPRVGDIYSVRWAWFMGVATAALALFVLAEAAPSTRPRRVGQYVGAAATAAGGWGAFLASIELNRSLAGGPPNWFFHFLPELIVGFALAGSAVLFVFAGIAAGRASEGSYGHAVIIGLAAGVAAAVTPGRLWIGFAVGAIVAVLGTAVAFRREDRVRRRAPEPDPSPNPYASP